MGTTRSSRRRPWTRAGAVLVAAHVFYELGAGVAMPLASRLGPAAPAALVASGTAVVWREAGRRGGSADRVFAVLNGAFLSAALGHFTSWPRTSMAGLPWLTECEGLTGRLMPPYNLLLHASAAAAVAGLVENRRALGWGLLTPLALVPIFVREAPREYARLRVQARTHPAWWNRRLQGYDDKPRPEGRDGEQ